MSSNNNTNDAKKRRVDGGGIGGDIASASGGGDREDILVHMMHQQMATITSMHNKMASMQDEMKSMQKDIKQLTKKCDNIGRKQEGIHEDIGLLQTNQNTNSTHMILKFKKVDDKLKYQDVLLQNQKWKYSVPRPDTAFWNGITDGGVLAEAEDFLVQMQKQTEDMRYGSSVEIRIDNGMTYHRKILPHWEEFADALEQYQYHLQSLDYDRESSLTLYDVVLSTEVINLLSKALKSTYFNGFMCQNNELDQNGIKFALDYLKKNRICKQFALHQNLMSMEDINRLCQIVKDHSSIKFLGLSGCKGADVNGYEILKQIMTTGTKKLEVLDISSNEISTGGDTFIPDFLAKNPILESLDLTDNELDDDDAEIIASALKHNTELRSLKMDDNNITNTGWDALSKTVFDKTSLNSAADSNHTCHIDFPLIPIHKYDHVREINGEESSEHYHHSKFVRQKKIYYILSSRNRSLSNVDHFNEGMPVEIPDMLTSIQRYSNYHRSEEDAPSQDPTDVKPLSIMFEILKRWDKSLAVFEAVSSL